MSEATTNLQRDAGAPEIRDWLVARLAAHFHISPSSIDPKTSFAELGLDSITGLTLTGDLADALDRELNQTLFWDYPTVESLSDFLAQGSRPGTADDDAEANPWPAIAARCGVSQESHDLLSERTGTWDGVRRARHGMLTMTMAGDAARLPLFWCGGLDRTVVLNKLTGRTFHIFPTGLGIVDHGEANVKALASLWVEEIRALAPKGPYLVGGYCYGGKTALEAVRLLRRASEAVALMVQLEWAGPSPGYWRWYRMKYPFLSTDARRDFRQYGQRVKEQGVVMATGRLAKQFARRVAKDDKMRPAQELVEHRRVRQLPVEVPTGAFWTYTPESVDVPTLVIAGRQSGLYTRAFGKLGWDGTINAPIDVAVVPGDHYSMVDGPAADELGRVLESRLAAAERAARGES